MLSMFPETYTAHADLTAAQYGIPADIFRAQIGKESAWDSNAIGKAGEIGLTQIMPTTAIQYGYSPSALMGNPSLQMQAGADILSKLYKKFGNWVDALAAYNAGPGNYQSRAGQAYAADVMAKSNGAAGMTAAQDTSAMGALDRLTNFVTGLPGRAIDAAKAYYVPAGLILLALLLIAAGAWKGVK